MREVRTQVSAKTKNVREYKDKYRIDAKCQDVMLEANSFEYNRMLSTI